MMANKKKNKNKKLGWFAKGAAPVVPPQSLWETPPAASEPVDVVEIPDLPAAFLLPDTEEVPAETVAEETPVEMAVEVPDEKVEEGVRRLGQVVVEDVPTERVEDEEPILKSLDEIMEPVVPGVDGDQQEEATAFFGEGLGDSFQLSQDHVRVLAAVVGNPGINKGGLEGVSTATRDATRDAIRDLVGAGLVKRVVKYPSVQHFFHGDEPES